MAQLEESGQPADYDSILRDIQQRDYQDSHRETAPLKPAEDSVLLDTTGEDFSQSLDRLVSPGAGAAVTIERITWEGKE